MSHLYYFTLCVLDKSMKPLTKIIFFIFQFFCFIIFSFRVLLTFVTLLLKQGSQLLQNDWLYKFVNELFCTHKVQERVTPPPL